MTLEDRKLKKKIYAKEYKQILKNGEKTIVQKYNDLRPDIDKVDIKRAISKFTMLKYTKRNMFFDLVMEEFIMFWEVSCVKCDADIKNVSLGLKDQSIGYTKNNVESVCKSCLDKKKEDQIKLLQKI